jgi:glycerate dehydrogenase
MFLAISSAPAPHFSDDQLNFEKLSEIVEFRRNDTDYVTNPKELVQLVTDSKAEIVITKEMKVPAQCVEAFPPTVKLLCEAGTGYNNIPIPAAQAKGITVCNIPTYSTDAVAHMAITYIMNLSIRMFEQQAMLQRGDRSNFTGPFTLPLTELGDKTLGLVGGSGMIGGKVADVALALGMKIIISSRAGKLPDDHRLASNPRVGVVSRVEDLLEEADYVSLHTPLNDKTRGTFGRAHISKMKPTAFLINTSRGAVCNEPELIECLKEGLIAGAGLDVTTTEPAGMDSELWDLPNVWLSPHIGWRRIETRQRLVDMTYDNILAYCNAKSPDDYINVVS